MSTKIRRVRASALPNNPRPDTLYEIGGDLYLGGTKVSGSAGAVSPAAFTSRDLTAADNGRVLTCSTAQTATVQSGMPTGFGVAVKGPISWTAGSGVTINDVRTTGAANPWCALMQTGTNTYDVIGGKA